MSAGNGEQGSLANGPIRVQTRCAGPLNRILSPIAKAAVLRTRGALAHGGSGGLPRPSPCLLDVPSIVNTHQRAGVGGW